MKLLGIDIGTTSISFTVMEKESKTLVKASTVGNESFMKTGNFWEKIQNAAEIEKIVTETVEKLFAEFTDIVSIGLTGQMHGILYTDGRGNCASPLYTWQDGRGNRPVFEGKSLTETIYEETGVQVYTGYGWVTHLYNQRKNLVPETAASFCTIADYIGMKLTGRERPLIHSSMAASFGFFDLERNQFRQDALELLGINCGIMPEISDKISVLGEFDGVPVYTAIGDNQASVLGAAGREPGTILVNMGTGGQLSVISDRNIEVPGIETRPFLDGNYLLVGASLCGGRAYAVLENFFRQYGKAAGTGDRAQYDIMEKILEQGETADPLKVRTTFQGTRTDPERRGSIEGISENNFTPAALIQGVLDGMAQELYEMYCEIRSQVRLDVSTMTAAGNGVRKNHYLQKAFEKIFDKKLVLAPYKEEAACGAAMSCCRLSKDNTENSLQSRMLKEEKKSRKTGSDR